jgi:hypothetical protein
VPDTAGQATTPNAIVVDDESDPQFVALGQPESGWCPVRQRIEVQQILAAAISCNVQETGVSCQSERRQGLYLLRGGYTPQYTDARQRALSVKETGMRIEMGQVAVVTAAPAASA